MFREKKERKESVQKLLNMVGKMLIGSKGIEKVFNSFRGLVFFEKHSTK